MLIGWYTDLQITLLHIYKTIQNLPYIQNTQGHPKSAHITPDRAKLNMVPKDTPEMLNIYFRFSYGDIYIFKRLKIYILSNNISFVNMSINMVV